MSSWFDFSGRISRRRFWLSYILPLTLLVLCAIMLDGLLITRGVIHGDIGVLTGLASVLAAIGTISACVQRLHDLDLNGGWVLLMAALPLVGPLLGIMLLGCLPGSAFRNRFGPVPA